MKTKDHHFLFDEDQNTVITSNDQYNNLNLNQNQESSLNAFSEASKNVLTKKEKVLDYNCEIPKTKTKKASHLWNQSIKDLPSNFVQNNADSEKEYELKKEKKINESTLSLHIEAYENNSTEASPDFYESLKEDGLKTKNIGKVFGDLTSVIQNPFEFPRQQESNESRMPEVAQHRASQHLLNPNQHLLPQHSDNDDGTFSPSNVNSEEDSESATDNNNSSNDEDEDEGDETSMNENNNNWKNNTELRDSLRLARDCVKRFETNVSIQTLKNTRDICVESIKQVGNFFVTETLGAPQSAGLLNIIAEIIHRVLNLIKSEVNITKLGKDIVLHSVDTFIELIEEIMRKVGSYDSTQSWIQSSSLENLSTAFPIEACVVRKKLTFSEVQAHSKLFLFKGDLLRYRCNILKEPYGKACKAYWIAFSLLPGQGIVFWLLGVIATTRDSTDRLSQTFYYMRAISTTTPFESAKIGLLTKLEQISQKIIKTEFTQQFEIFKDPSVTDINGRYALTANSLHSNEYYFAWMPSSTSETSDTKTPNWKEKLSRFPRSMIFKMLTDNLFHMVNLLITKQTHTTLFATCERFLALTSYILETEEISGKELLQITTIFILGLKCRDSYDESFEMLSRTFLHFIGILFSKLYQIMINRNDSPNFPLEQKGMIILPSIIIIDSYWSSFDDKIPVDSFRSRSYTFDFSNIRKNLAKLGPRLQNYIQTLNVSVKRTKNDFVAENVYLLPEVILCCMGSRFPVATAPFHLISAQKYSETFNTFLIRVVLAHDLLTRMLKKEYFGIDAANEMPPELYDLSTFELFILAYQKQQKVYAIYPEFLIVDTVALLEAHQILKEFVKHGIKIIIPNIVFTDLTEITNDFTKPELFRVTATKVKEMIVECIEKGSDQFQLFDFNGERKFLFSINEIGVHFPKHFSHQYPANLNKFDFIYNIYKYVDEIYDVKSETYGFYAPNIKVTKVLLLSDTLCEHARRYGIPAINLLSFVKWFKNCVGSNNIMTDDKKVEDGPENEMNIIENYFSVISNGVEALLDDDWHENDNVDDEDVEDVEDNHYNHFDSEIKRQISNIIEENEDHVKYPMHAKENVVKGVQRQQYPVGVIPPHYISTRHGVWTEPSMAPNNSNFQLFNSNTSASFNEE